MSALVDMTCPRCRAEHLTLATTICRKMGMRFWLDGGRP
jgi:hypothetical protein